MGVAPEQIRQMGEAEEDEEVFLLDRRGERPLGEWGAIRNSEQREQIVLRAAIAHSGALAVEVAAWSAAAAPVGTAAMAAAAEAGETQEGPPAKEGYL